MAGLTHVPTPQLERLLRAVLRGRIRCPLEPQDLMLAGLSDVYDRVGALRGLDERAVKTVLLAVLAERKPLRPPKSPK
ncbi:MAG: hypothetical protein AAGA56_24615 [Myxococcota bacterium]